DERGQLLDALDIRQAHRSVTGKDTAIPTQYLLDREGVVRWFYRSETWRGRPAPRGGVEGAAAGTPVVKEGVSVRRRPRDDGTDAACTPCLTDPSINPKPVCRVRRDRLRNAEPGDRGRLYGRQLPIFFVDARHEPTHDGRQAMIVCGGCDAVMLPLW